MPYRITVRSAGKLPVLVQAIQYGPTPKIGDHVDIECESQRVRGEVYGIRTVPAKTKDEPKIDQVDVLEPWTWQPKKRGLQKIPQN